MKGHPFIDRKCHDVANVGHTFWVTCSQAAPPQIVQTFCHEHDAQHVIFVAKVRKASRAATASMTRRFWSAYSAQKGPRSVSPTGHRWHDNIDYPLKLPRSEFGHDLVNRAGFADQQQRPLIQSASYPRSASSIDPDLRRDKRTQGEPVVMSFARCKCQTDEGNGWVAHEAG